ncbi:tetratricopeptide repeat protein [Ramlibacter sp.]|uniref:tetratricopeptide repeat protein n=1 Tax=Ramlibacter sp. TaxID=1917967 RepID=UPI002D36F2C7|nr:tetratricopeptide repeat protein [Ramlibacter sp.]HYD77531.1 tetratricopeptide repeat protein [Ramlibacter sp.]
MNPAHAALKAKFRAGQHAEAIAECEALCRDNPGDIDSARLCATMQLMVRNFARARELLGQVHRHAPADADVLFNLGMCERELGNFAAAADHFRAYADRFPGHADGWASLAECKLHLGAAEEGIELAERALQIDAAFVPAWSVRGRCEQALGRHEQAIATFNRAIQLAPNDADLRQQRGDAWEQLGGLREAAEDYRVVLALRPADEQALKKATLCLLHAGEGALAIQVCRDVLKAQPDSLAARLGAEWLVSQMVPLWHVPMMNEAERNRAYEEGLRGAVSADKTVFEIGTGSGLVAMMAARLGARKVVTCEAEGLVADAAMKIVARNGYQDRVKVLHKPSFGVDAQRDLGGRADILVHEIFSSELLGEHVLPALEDAKARLLKPGGEILPAAASIMVALVGGEELGRELRVQDSFGFDLRPFNAIQPRKRPLHREDLPRVLLSEAVEAFRFDFQQHDTFPPEKKRLELPVVDGGLCWGVIQWIRIDFGRGVLFENHPSRSRAVASWQQAVYLFDEPRQVEPGQVVPVRAMHDRSRPWFEAA